MRLSPHLHLLVPSSTAGILLEARLYLFFPDRKSEVPLSTSASSTPIRYDQLPPDQVEELQRCSMESLITAAHPWQKLGGNQLDPVLTHCLVQAIEAQSTSSALITFNARGVGLSEGSIGLLGLNTKPGERDFEAVEKYARDLLRPKQIRRVGYSWGSILALNAPSSDSIHSTLLIAPPSTLFGLTTLLSSRTFGSALKGNQNVTIVHGTKDQFTGVSAYEGLAREGEVAIKVVNKADHFFRDENSVRQLVQYMRDWLAS